MDTYNLDMVYLTAQASKFNYLDMCNVILEDPRFPIWTATAKHDGHHYGMGGLLKHTREVVELCLLNVDYFNTFCGCNINAGNIFLAALFHDVGKMWDYAPVNNSPHYREWKNTDHRKLIYHLPKSALVWNEVATKWKIDEITKEEVTHCILSHHGQRCFSAQVEPQTKSAWILHLCDNMSARVNDVYKDTK